MASPTSKGPRSNPSQRPASDHRLKAIPAPAPSPLAALVAGLAALIEAHQASATSGAALVLWQVLSSLHALASRVLAAPSALSLEALAAGPLAAGLMVREEGVPAARVARTAPRLSGVHRELIGHAHELLEELDTARWHAHFLANDLEAIRDHDEAGALKTHTTSALEDLAQLRTALGMAEGAGCALSSLLTGVEMQAPPSHHITALARLTMATSPQRDEWDRRELETAAQAFASASP